MVFTTKSEKLLRKIIIHLPKQLLQNLRLYVEHPVFVQGVQYTLYYSDHIKF